MIVDLSIINILLNCVADFYIKLKSITSKLHIMAVSIAFNIRDILYADAEKCFGKLWVKDSLIEMERIGYNKSDIKMLYEISKTTEIVVDIATGKTENIEITEVVKQGSIFGPTLCCATTAKVNDVGEKFDYKYGKIEIDLSIYMDDISVVGRPEEVKKGIRECVRIEQTCQLSRI